ncbi:MAG: tyrosine-type recombinase/integrase [Flavobacteriales bacterium]|nr:tyrosine-type recombinase/integrase [Flavobacteriales bacterium]
MSITFNGIRIQTTINEKIDEKHWNKKKQRLKGSSTDAFNINSYLNKIENNARDIHYKFKLEGIIPTKKQFKEKLYQKLNGVNTSLSFYDFVDEFIKNSKNSKKPSTTKEYIYTIEDLKSFEKHNKRRIDWDTLDLQFYESYMDYQYNVKGNSQNLFGKRIKTIKTFLNDATKKNINKHLMFYGFKVLKKRSDNIYLNEDDLKKIYKLDLSNNKRLERVRDLFIVGCRTGLRFSDLTSLRKEDITKDGIRFQSDKTEEVLNTVIIEETQEILEKYNYQLPKISRTNLNKYIKEVGELADISEVSYKDTFKSGKAISKKLKKYERISSHTARRSFATNMYKRRFPIYYIMKITGHKKESDFLDYIKVTNEEAVKIISMNYKKMSS